MSFVQVEKLRSVLGHLLEHVQPPASHPPRASTPAEAEAKPSTGKPSNTPFAPISIRWPSCPPPPTLPALLDALTAHDLVLLAAHSVILLHGARLDTSNSDKSAAASSEARAIAATTSTSSSPPPSSSAPLPYLPPSWNSSRLLYSLRYTLTTPITHPPSSSSDDLSNAEVLTADTPIAYLLTVKAVPLSGFLVLSAQLHHISPVDGAHSAVSPPYKVTLRCEEYVDVAHVLKHIASPSLTPVLPAGVYLNLDWLWSGVANGLMKRCMGPLWTLFFSPRAPAAHFMSPHLPDLPVDLLTVIVLYLGSRELVRLGQTCADLQALTSMPLFWRLLCDSECPTNERGAVDKEDWRAELIVRKRLKQEEARRNRFALVPVGLPIDIRGDRRNHVGGARGERPFFPFPLGRDVNDPLGLGEWRTVGGGRRWHTPMGDQLLNYREMPNEHWPMYD